MLGVCPVAQRLGLYGRSFACQRRHSAGLHGIHVRGVLLALKFNGQWRFNPPADARFVNGHIPDAAVSECIDVIMRVATQGDRRSILEHFKGYFCEACGVTHIWSSDVGWADTDLRYQAAEAAQNAPSFIDAFYSACRDFVGDDADLYAPDAPWLNGLLSKHGIGYEVRPPRLVLREAEAPLVDVLEPPITFADQGVEMFQASLRRSEELLGEGRGREAVQESLWLLESAATAFEGVETEAGTVGGKYFNRIVKDLRKSNPDTTLERILEWLTSLHGYLSSPSGGGVRHGLNLNRGVPITNTEARLFCNLVRSYLSFLMSEHAEMIRAQTMRSESALQQLEDDF